MERDFDHFRTFHHVIVGHDVAFVVINKATAGARRWSLALLLTLKFERSGTFREEFLKEFFKLFRCHLLATRATGHRPIRVRAATVIPTRCRSRNLFTFSRNLNHGFVGEFGDVMKGCGKSLGRLQFLARHRCDCRHTAPGRCVVDQTCGRHTNGHPSHRILFKHLRHTSYLVTIQMLASKTRTAEAVASTPSDTHIIGTIGRRSSPLSHFGERQGAVSG